MPVTAARQGPYAPPTTVMGVVTRFRERGLSLPINREVLARASIPESLIPRTIQSLITLDLIDDEGMPTKTLEGLQRATEAEFKSRLAEWIKGTYADVFKFVDPAADNEVQIRDAFRSYQPVGQQARMVTLFRELCIAAGLITKKEGAAPRTTAPKVRTATYTGPVRAPMRPPMRPPMRSTASRGLADAGPPGLPPALNGLIASLPDAKVGWTAADRDRFLNTFRAVLDYSIPVVEKPAQNESGDPDEAAA
jgi:hypothetical protein